jgi:hypothetical protein
VDNGCDGYCENDRRVALMTLRNSHVRTEGIIDVYQERREERVS